jgi:hypothetical protein
MVEIKDIDCQGATMRLRSSEAEARGGGVGRRQW